MLPVLLLKNIILNLISPVQYNGRVNIQNVKLLMGYNGPHSYTSVLLCPLSVQKNTLQLTQPKPHLNTAHRENQRLSLQLKQDSGSTPSQYGITHPALHPDLCSEDGFIA